MAAAAPGDASASVAPQTAEANTKEEGEGENKGESSSKALEELAADGSQRMIMFGVVAACSIIAISLIGVLLMRPRMSSTCSDPREQQRGKCGEADTFCKRTLPANTDEAMYEDSTEPQDERDVGVRYSILEDCVYVRGHLMTPTTC
ncbi:uncharacterized protein LOC144098152 [Amblyomma americanum]